MKLPVPESSAAFLSIALLLTFSLLGCGQDNPPKPESTDPAPLPTANRGASHRPLLPEALLPDGTTITLELAITPDEIQQGLMFRTALPETRGMLFLFESVHVPSFWMKNTLIPLDMVFLSPEGVIVDVVHDARPCKEDPCPQYVPTGEALAVLELASGAAARHGLVAGARLEFRRVPGYPAEGDPGATVRPQGS